ncbi:MAG: SDR family NAD(P)-dependent oxidoreductase [Actinomycetota bacterium]
MKYYLITGTSRGLGKALVGELAGEGTTVFCVSRSGTDTSGLGSGTAPVVDLPFDLARLDGLDGLMDDVFARIDLAAAEGLYLINNAGLLDPVAAVEHLDPEAMALHVTVNLVAPMRLTSLFIGHSGQATCRRVVANVSSSAAANPYRGWGVYCAAKAGLDQFGRVAGLEQRDRAEQTGAEPVIVYSVAPGKVDTAMQASLRERDPRDFPDRDAFVSLKETGALNDAAAAARAVAATLDDPSITSGDVIDVRDAVR